MNGAYLQTSFYHKEPNKKKRLEDHPFVSENPDSRCNKCYFKETGKNPMSNGKMREAKKDLVKRVKDVKYFLNKRTFIIRPIHSSQQLQKEERKVEAQDKELSHRKKVVYQDPSD